MRRTIIFTLVVLLVAFIVLAFYRQWLIVGVHSPQEGQVQLAVTFDHKQLSEDFASFTGNRPTQPQSNGPQE